jgi:hypothetical protein
MFHIPWGQSHYRAVRDETLYQKAFNIAEDQEAKLWELRAAVSLARLRPRPGLPRRSPRPPLPSLRLVYRGFDTPDPKAAKALLDDLA